MSKTVEILGEQAGYYLSHVCRTIDKRSLYLPGPDTVERIWTDSDPRRVEHGRRGRRSHDLFRFAGERPMKEGIALLHAIQDVYLDDEVTIA